MLSLHLSNPHIWPKLDCKKSNGLGVELFLAAAYKRAAWANQGPKGMLPILHSLTMPSIMAPCASLQKYFRSSLTSAGHGETLLSKIMWMTERGKWNSRRRIVNAINAISVLKSVTSIFYSSWNICICHLFWQVYCYLTAHSFWLWNEQRNIYFTTSSYIPGVGKFLSFTRYRHRSLKILMCSMGYGSGLIYN